VPPLRSSIDTLPLHPPPSTPLTAALRKGGLEPGQLLGGIFRAEVADGSKLGLVGEIQAVHAAPVNEVIAAGKIPVLTSLGLSACVPAAQCDAAWRGGARGVLTSPRLTAAFTSPSPSLSLPLSSPAAPARYSTSTPTWRRASWRWRSSP
jgi:hypothetical protein